jgi:hypothetical protein
MSPTEQSAAAVSRALSPRPTRLVYVALALFFVGERVVGEGTSRLLLDGFALVFFLAAFAWVLVTSRAAPAAARSYGTAVLLGYVGLGVGGLLYSAFAWLAEAETPDPAAPYLQIASLILLVGCTGVLAAIEMSGTPMRAAGFVEMPRVREAAGTAATLALALAGLIFLNAAFARDDLRKDFSLSGPSSPSDATLSLLQARTEPVEVFLFFEKGSPALTLLGDYFEGLAVAGASKRVLDQALDAELAKELKVSRNGTIAFRSEKRSETWYIGSERDAVARKLSKLDTEVLKRLTKLARDQKNVYFTRGHGERGTRASKPGERPGAATINKLAGVLNVRVKNLGLAEGLGNKIPDDADVVVVHGPTGRFVPGEVQALKSYVEDGGALLLLLDPGVDTGLDEVLELLGVEARGAPLANDREFVRRSHTAADHVFLFSNSFASHKAIKTLNDARSQVALLFLEAQGIERLEDAKAKVTLIARSRKDTFEDANNNRRFDKGEERKVFAFAAASELRLEGRENDARAVIVGDSDTLSDLLAVTETNAAFGYEALLWLLRDDQIGGAAPLDEDVPIVHTRDDDAMWFYGSTVVAPGLVLALGLAVVRARRRRRGS